MSYTTTTLIRWLLLGTAVIPLIITPGLLFPFVTGKSFLFRILIEITTLLALFLLWIGVFPIERMKKMVRHPAVVSVYAFFIVYVLSAFFAVDRYSAFLGNIERMEGVLGMSHFFLFFVLLVLFFRKEDWIVFLKLFLVTSIPVFLVALFQYVGVSFSALLSSDVRPGSLLGNPAFVGVHFLFVLAASLILFDEYKMRRDTFWRGFAVVCGILSLAGIFLSQTRGVLLGLSAGLFVWAAFWFFEKGRRVRWWYVAVVCVLFLGILVFTRHLTFWQYIPGVGRLLATSASDETVQTRLIATGVSWEAFKARPILGWGPENYAIAFNTHYNPEYLAYEEAWFDRPHNKVAEVAVTSGILGFLAYLGIFLASFWVLRRTGTKEKVILSKHQSYYVFAAFVAYFVQNIGLFDQVNSYLLFFAFLGLIVSSDNSALIEGKKGQGGVFKKILLLGAGSSIILMFFAYTVTPYFEVRNYGIVTKSRVAEEIVEDMDSFLYPVTFAQGNIRSILAGSFLTPDILSRQEFDFLSDKVILALEEWIEFYPHDPRFYIQLIEAYNEKAKRDPSFFEKAEDTARKALILAPRRQELHFQLAYTLVSRGEYEKARDVAQRAVELAPRVGKSHYILGVILSLSGEGFWGKGEEAMDRGLELGLTKMLEDDRRNILVISKRNMAYAIKRRDGAGAIRNAQRIIFTNPKEKRNFEEIIRLVEEQNWSKLDSIVQ